MMKMTRLKEMRREMGVAQYYAWRFGCKMHRWQKQFDYSTAAGRLSEYVEDILCGIVYGMADICTYVSKNWLKTAFRAIVGVYIVATILTACGASESAHSTYPKLLQVVGVQGAYGDWCIDFMDANGFTYHIDLEDGDFEASEFYTCIMDDMGTRQIADDQIVSMRYERVDLFK